jgi:membrane protein
LLAGVSVPRHDLMDAAVFGGVGLGLLKIFAGILLNGASNNKFLLSAGLLLGLLVWLNLVSRLTLVAAAWGAIVALDRGHLVEALPAGATEVADDTTDLSAQPGRSATRPPAPPGRPVSRAAVAPPRVPVVSPRAADRVSVAAGAILGATALMAVHSTSSAIRALVRSARSGDDET